MKKKKQRRNLALLLAVLCFLISPMSVYASVERGDVLSVVSETAKTVNEKEAKAGQDLEIGKETETREQQEMESAAETEQEKQPDGSRQTEAAAETESEPSGAVQSESAVDSETEPTQEAGAEQGTEANEEEQKMQELLEEVIPQRAVRAANNDSVYLTARKNAVTLDKVPAVTVGNVNTQIPDGYEGYVRTVTGIETNFSSQTFVPDTGALKGKDGCIRLTDKDKNKYYAWYRKSMYYQGLWVDIKMTLTDFELRNNAIFRFVPNRPGIETYQMEWADTKMEFFRSDTGAAINVKGYITFRDIDLFQGIVLKDGFGQVYAGPETLPNLKAVTINGRNYYFDITGLNQTSADKGFMLSALIGGAAASATFTFVRKENDLGTSLTPSGGISAESYKIFASAHPHIEKYISDSDEKMKEINTLENRDEAFTYTLMTTVPMETEGTVYKDWSVYDTLDDYLEIRNVSVVDENGADASGYWSITSSNQFLAQCKNIRNLGFYGHTYQFRITVGIKKEAALKNRWDSGIQQAVIRNQAHASSDGKTADSRTVITKIPAIPSKVSVEKKDGLTGEKLSGAEFSIYEWNKGSYKTTPLAVLKQDEDGIYTSKEILTYTGENQGKFKIAEVKAPVGYQNKGWEKEFTISGFSRNSIVYKGEDACIDEPQWIRVSVKKKDAETGKAAAGAVFSVYQWSEKEKGYVAYGSKDNDYEFVTDENGDAVSSRLYYQPDNQGKFRIEEKQAPENYFGDYKEGASEKEMKSYDFQIEENISGQTLALSNVQSREGFVNVPQKAAIAVKKTGKALQGAENSEKGVSFRYEKTPLAGARYEIIAAEDIYKADGVTLFLKKGAVADEIETDKNGRALSKMLYLGKYNVVEIQAPKGYVLGKTAAELSKTVDLDYRGQEIYEYVCKEIEFQNARPKALVTVWKKSKNTGAGLAGAVFGLYAGEHIRVDGDIVAAKGTLIEKAVSKKDGSCCFQTDIPCGYEYYVEEISAPSGYYKQTEKKKYEFDWRYKDDHTDFYTFPEAGKEEDAVFYNQEVRADISLKKVDAESGLSVPQQSASLQGAIYGLYAREDIPSLEDGKTVLFAENAEVLRAVTDREGRLCFENVPLGKYYVKEIQASEGYLADAAVYEVDCAYEGQEIPVIKRTVTSKERVKKQKIRCFKLTGDNKETDLEWMEGAGFSIYSVEEVEKKEGLEAGTYTGLDDEELVQTIIDTYRDKDSLDYSPMKRFPTALVYSEGGKAKRIPELYSDESGILETAPLPYGRYLLVETTMPKGKAAAAPKIITVDSDAKDEITEGDGKGTALADFAIWDQPKTSYLKITKKDAVTGRKVAKEGAKYVIHDVDGAYFKWYMKDKTSQERIDYINRFGNLVVAYTNGDIAGSYESPYETAVRRDADGRNIGTYVSTTEKLPKGLYILEEVAAPEGYVKQGFEGVYRRRNGDTFFEAAALNLPELEAMHSLAVSADDVGKWEPAGKASKDNRIKINIGSDSENTKYDLLAGAFVTEVCQENEPAVGKLSIYAEGEVLKDWNMQKGFTYEYHPIEGNIFTIRAAENIFSNEGDGNQTLLFAKGSVVTELITDKDGKAWTEQIEAAGFSWYGLPLGIYTVEQTKAAEGYVVTEENHKPRTFEISYAGQEIPIVYQNALYEVQRQKVRIQAVKQDIENGTALAGAVFGLYTGQDIFAADGRSVLVKKDTRIAEAKTEEGAEHVENAVFDLELPCGFYYIREEKAPSGYYLSSKVCSIDARYQKNGGGILKFTKIFENRQTMLQVNFMDYDTEIELDKVQFSILDEEGNTVNTQISVHNRNVWIRGLEPEKRYQIIETQARAGYHWALLEKEGYESAYVKEGYEADGQQYNGKALKPIRFEENRADFMLTDEDCVQVMSLFNQSVQGELHISKKGEVPKTKFAGSKLSEIYYESEGLPGAEYDVFAEETVEHPDGYSDPVYRAGEKIDHLVTDQQGEAILHGLFAGKYCVKETKAPAGYSRDEKKCRKVVEMCWKDSAAASMRTEAMFENPRQRPDIGQDSEDGENPDTIVNDYLKGKTGILKISADGEAETPAPGAEFALYAKKDIQNVKGEIVIPAGTEIERVISDAYGRAAFLAELPMGSYCVRETKAADGCYLSEAEVLFDFEPYMEDDRITVVRMRGIVRNAVTEAKIFLKDDLTQKELAGAILQISDESGKVQAVIHTKNTDGDGHTVKGLIPGKKYKITEVAPREGYVSTVYVPQHMSDVLKKTGKREAIFSIPDASTDAGLKNIPEPLILELENAFITGNVKIAKTGELLNAAEREVHAGEGLFNLVKTWFRYLLGGVENAEFSVFAEKDIYHPDGVTGLLYRAGDLVECRVREEKKVQAVILTDAAGRAEFLGMYPGQYVLKETNIPEGYRENTESLNFTLADAGEDKDIVLPKEGILPVYNERQKVDICVTKKDKERPEKVLGGAIFGLYAKEDIRMKSGSVLLEAGTLIETQKTDADGKAHFTSSLPNGIYEVAELAAPAGYVNSGERLEVNADWKEDGIPVQSFSLDFSDEITKVNIIKRAEDTGEIMKGAKLAIYQGNTCVESWITGEKPHCVEGLKVGEAYILKEICPAPGYVTAKDVNFTVQDASDGVYKPQEIEMTDDATEIHIAVFEKDGDRKIPLGNVKAHLETMDGKKLGEKDNPSGKSGVWESRAGEDEIWKKIPVGEYLAVTDEVPEGYVLPKDVTVEVRDTSQIQYFEILVQPVCIRITGYGVPSAASDNKSSKTMLDGIFAHMTGLFGEKSEELPVTYSHVPSGQYDILTDKVPLGYVLPAKTAIQVRDDTSEIQDFEVTVRPTVIKITAVDKKTQKVLDGVKVTVLDENGKTVWKNTALTALKEKVVPAGYTVKTVKVPDGYRIPENKNITVKAVTSLQKYKIELTKKDNNKNRTSPPLEGGSKITQNGGTVQDDTYGKAQNPDIAAKTGDASDIAGQISVSLLAAVTFIIAFRRRKKS